MNRGLMSFSRVKCRPWVRKIQIIRPIEFWPLICYLDPMSGQKNNDLIVRPFPIRGFERKLVIYVPFDTPSGIIHNHLKLHSLRKKDTGTGILYLLPEKIVLFGPVGAPAAILILERLIASGAEEIILLGYCGSLNSAIPNRSSISVTAAHSEEGTSRHYFNRKKIFHPSSDTKTRLEACLEGSGFDFVQGILVTTDAPYRETYAWLKEKQAQGIDGVDMETSAVLALAEYHNIKAAAFMIVSDELGSGEWKNAFKHPETERITSDQFLRVIDSMGTPES
jgi:uridine phosphorylase